MILNAEGLPIYGIDRLQLTLNKNINNFINYTKTKHIDPNNYIRLDNSNKFGVYWYLTIHAQKINHLDIRMGIAEVIFNVINKKIIDFPIFVPLMLIYFNLEWFVSEIREIEFYFDFKPEDITFFDTDIFKIYKNSKYSSDCRKYKNNYFRKSNIVIYYRPPKLKKINQISHKIIDSNPYKTRIEFRVYKYNCQYRTLNNLSGNYSQIIRRYSPLLSTLFNRHFLHKVIVNIAEHPYFSEIYLDAVNSNRTRYTGLLEKMKPHVLSENENEFYKLMFYSRFFNIDYSVSHLT